ncbi:ASCH domain-containing protein [Pseudooceanicola sp.]|uniref:ASCH domain-containing protein n=1 Tax=Pseudooceanicola sp. TaxID=1914328 RepID=UPI0035C66E0F
MQGVTFTFGDNEDLCNEVLALVRAGKKTVTCAPLSDFGPGKDPMPEVGRQDTALEWDGSPGVRLETVEVLTIPFDEVTEALVADMGEFRDRDDFRAQYRAYFEKQGKWSDTMMLMVERFRLIEDLAEVTA